MYMTNGITNAAVAASNSVLDIGDESMAMVVVCRLTFGHATVSNLFGKRASAGGVGYSLEVGGDARHLSWRVHGDTLVTSTALNVFAQYGDPIVILVGRDKNANSQFIHVRKLSSTISDTDTPPTGSLSNTETFKCPTHTRSPRGNVALAAVWVGSSAEGLNATHAESLYSELGLRTA
jgi:hypothetical protein